MIAQWRPRVWEDLGSLCTPMTSRAAHIDVGLFEEAFGGLVGNESVANGSGGGGEELVHDG